LARRLVLAGVSLLFGLAIIETGFRAARGTPWYERLAEEQTTHTPAWFKVGRIRAPLRGPPIATPKSADAYRILFLGDSFTYGHGFADASKTFVGRVGQRLNNEQPHPRIRGYELFNGGMPGTGTREWLVLFEDVVDSFTPDLVVAVFFLRDGVADVTSVEQIDKIREGMAQLANESLLFRYSYAYRFFRERRALSELSRKYLGRLHQGYLGRPNQTREWKRAQANLLQIKQQTLARGAQFAIVIFPVLFELNDHYPLADVCDVIKTFCHDHDIPVLSLLPTFMNMQAPSLWLSPLDQHPNEQGHALAADAIYRFLERLICAGEENADTEMADGPVSDDRADRAIAP